MAANAIVYESRNRLTGTLCQTIDTRHPDAAKLGLPKRPKGQEQHRYAARCVEHKSTVFFMEHYPAGRAIAHVDEWCDGCKKMIQRGDEKMKDGSKGAAARTRAVPSASRPAQPARAAASTKAPAQPAKSNGKVSSDKKANDARNRQAAAARKPSEVKTTAAPKTTKVSEPAPSGSISEAVQALRTPNPTAVGAAMEKALESAQAQPVEA